MADKTGPALTAAFDALFRAQTAPAQTAAKEVKERQTEEELREHRERMKEKYR